MVFASKDFVGPNAWRVLHSYAAGYSPDQKNDFTKLVKTLTETFQCTTCLQNFKKKLEIVPLEPYLTNNHDLFFWTYVMHDMVNQAISKTDPANSKVSPAYDKIKYIYFSIMGEQCNDCEVPESPPSPPPA